MHHEGTQTLLQSFGKVEQCSKNLIIKEKTGSGIIQSSLWWAMEESNLSAKLVNIFADEIYPWTIDFFRINPGDRFKVIYDAKYVDGEFIGVGKVHAALFHTNNQDYYAIAFNELGGFEDYFDEEGKLNKIQVFENDILIKCEGSCPKKDDE